MKTMSHAVVCLAVNMTVLPTQPERAVAITLRQAPSDTSARYVDVTVEVVNNNLLDMRVYAVSHGRSHRLGTVSSFTRERFRLPRSLVAPNDEVRFIAQPIGSRTRHTTPTVTFIPGDVLEFRIETSIRMSTVRVVS